METNANPAAKNFQDSLFEQGIPLTALKLDELHSECKKLSAAGVTFATESTRAGEGSFAVFANSCGRPVQIYQPGRERRLLPGIHAPAVSNRP